MFYSFAGNENKKCFVPRGKGLGGSSLINCLFYSRGNKIDYLKWSKTANDSSWRYENLLRYFKKSENFTRKALFAPLDKDYHGFHGPLHVSQSIPIQNFTHYIIHGIEELGYNLTDYNGRQQMGVSVFQYFTKDGRRFDPEMGYISPVKHRKNLEILDLSYVTKLVLDKSSKTVKGVIFTKQNKTYLARNRLEIILSAGAINSPHILMLSGMGPKDHLKSLNISVVQNLPVGENLHDHTITFLIFSANKSSETENLENSVRQFLQGEGPLTRSFKYDTVGWLQTKNQHVRNFPNIELVTHNMSGALITKKFFGWSDKTYETMNANVSNPFTFILTPCHPTSTGTVKLKSADPFEYPLINSNILSNIDDVDTLYEGLQLILKLIKTEVLRPFNFEIAFNRFPGCNHTKRNSKEYWYCYFRKVTGIGQHSSGTCAIGTNPESAVVDNNLKVFGIHKLRIADASIIPFNLAGHPNAACNMIGEKISDVIKKKYGKYNEI